MFHFSKTAGDAGVSMEATSQSNALAPEPTMPHPKTRKLTPVLMVDAIEPCLPLWTERLGWEQTVAVPEGDRLGFVILTSDGVELMYQTWESVEKDIGVKLDRPDGTSVGLFIEVEDLDDVAQRIDGLEIVVPRRTTFYGMDEIGIREAGGHTVLFARRTGPNGEG